MSNGVSLFELNQHLVPANQPRCTVTGDTAAQIAAAATQGGINAVSTTAPIVTDGGSHKIAVSCLLANLKNKIDATSVLEIIVEAGQNLSAPTATTGTFLGGAISTVRGIFNVRPNAAGLVEFTVTLAAADATPPKVTLRHRQFVSSTGSLAIA